MSKCCLPIRLVHRSRLNCLLQAIALAIPGVTDVLALKADTAEHAQQSFDVLCNQMAAASQSLFSHQMELEFGPWLCLLLQSQMQQLYDKVVQRLHGVLDQPEEPPGTPTEVMNAPQLLTHLKAQADAAEAAGDEMAASRYHLERCTVAATDPQVILVITASFPLQPCTQMCQPCPHHL